MKGQARDLPVPMQALHRHLPHLLKASLMAPAFVKPDRLLRYHDAPPPVQGEAAALFPHSAAAWGQAHATGFSIGETRYLLLTWGRACERGALFWRPSASVIDAVVQPLLRQYLQAFGAFDQGWGEPANPQWECGMWLGSRARFEASPALLDDEELARALSAEARAAWAELKLLGDDGSGSEIYFSGDGARMYACLMTGARETDIWRRIDALSIRDGDQHDEACTDFRFPLFECKRQQGLREFLDAFIGETLAAPPPRLS